MIGHALLTFSCGALYEAGCVAFVHNSESGRPGRTALASMLTAACEVTGLLEAVRDWRLGVLLIVGFGAGSFAAVAFKARAS